MSRDNIKMILKTMINDHIELLENVNSCIINRDSSKLSFLKKDLQGIMDDINQKKNNAMRKAIDSAGFFESMRIAKDATRYMSRIKSLNSRLSEEDLYIKTSKLGIQIIEDNFQDQNDIDIFNKKFDECQYYKDKYMQVID